MIGKIIRGTNALGLVEYLMSAFDQAGRERSAVTCLGGTIAGSVPREVAAQFELLSSLRPTLNATVMHLMLRWTATDHLTIEQQSDMAALHAEALGYQHWCAFGHDDHVHIVASRVNGDGSVVSDSCDWSRAETSVRALEKQFGLKEIECSHLLDRSRRETHKAAPSAAELALAEKGVPSIRLQLQQAIDAALGDGATFATFVDRLQAAGIEVRPNLQSTKRLSGLSFLLDGSEMKGSSLGKSYSLNQLIRKGLDYDEKRDCDVARECICRSEARGDKTGDGQGAVRNAADFDGDPSHDRKPASSHNARGTGDHDLRRGGEEHPDRREPASAVDLERRPNDLAELTDILQKGRAGIGHQSGKVGHGIGQTERDPAKTGHESRGLRGNHRDEATPVPVVADNHRRGTGLAGANSSGVRVGRSRASGRAGLTLGGTASGAGSLDFEAMDGSETGEEALRKWARNTERSMRRLLAAENALIASNNSSEPALLVFPMLRRLTALARIEAPNDPTVKQIREQVRGFDCPQLEIGVLPPRHRADLRPERTRVFSPGKLCEPRTIAWLRRMNALDRDIFCRPAQRKDGLLEPLVLIDDLSLGMVARMRDEALPLAICVESSPGRFHGWVRVSHQPISVEQAQVVARELARRYGGDPAAARWNQYGRLAGFTNRKKERRSARGAPFARLRSAAAEVASGGAALLAYTQRQLDQEQSQTRREPATRSMSGMSSRSSPPVATFIDARERVSVLRPDGSCDQSAADFGAACSMLEHGFDPEQVVAALLDGSPDVFERHTDAAAYARRTVEAAQRRVAAISTDNTVNPPALRPR